MKKKTAVTILGSGTAVPSLKRSSSAFLLETGTSSLLFDIGAGTMRRIIESGRSIACITHIFLSHLHPDHCGEFISFLFSTKYGGILDTRKPFTVVGADGTRKFYEQNKTIYGTWIDMGDLMKIRELSPLQHDTYTCEDFEIASFPMAHISSSIGYRLTTPDGLSIAYTGDTDLCENIISLAQECDLFICESSFPENRKKEGHLTPFTAGKIASCARVKHLVLTHFYPECDEVDAEKECRLAYSGKLTIAEDLMTIPL